ncbi:MAG: hypothetical protein AAFX05_09250 [Planctomycetota bacterium]
MAALAAAGLAVVASAQVEETKGKHETKFVPELTQVHCAELAMPPAMFESHIAQMKVQLSARAATNDLCDDAIDVGALPASVIGSTTDATVDTDVAGFSCGTSISAPGVWYTVEGTGTTMTATLCSEVTNYDTKLSVFCRDCDVLNCIGGNDDNFSCPVSGVQSEVSWCSEFGVTYRILVHGFGSSMTPPTAHH